MGKATKNLSNEFRDKDPEIPWRQMAGMRDKLIHGYFGVDVSCGTLLKRDLPVLKKELQKIASNS